MKPAMILLAIIKIIILFRPKNGISIKQQFGFKMNKCDELIDKLNLIPHPEGGHFAETLRDINGHVSHIYYLLKKMKHRIGTN